MRRELCSFARHELSGNAFPTFIDSGFFGVGVSENLKIDEKATHPSSVRVCQSSLISRNASDLYTYHIYHDFMSNACDLFSEVQYEVCD